MGIDEPEWVLTDHNGGRVWVRSSAQKGEQISTAANLVIRGEGFADEATALTEGERWRDALQAAFSRLAIGADFGERGPRSMWTAAGLMLLERQVGSRVLNDQPGVMVFECEPEPRFVGGTAKPVVTKSGERVEQAVEVAAQSGLQMGEQERLSFDLFSASFFQPSPDGRLLMLMMAIETLLDLQPRDEECIAHVEHLIALTRDSDLPEGEVNSLVGSLEWLKEESIGQAGRKLVRVLEPRQYMDMPPVKFFTRCYEMRSELAHGQVPRPAAQEVDLLAANLEMMVGHLLCGDALRGLDFDA